MREYAALKTQAAHEEDLLAERYIEYYRTTCLYAAPSARFRLADWLAWAELELDNIRAVLHGCAIRHDSARGLDIAASLRYYWVTHGTTESIRWLDQLLAADDASPRTLVSAYYLRGWLSMLQADPAAARPWLARAVAAARVSSPVPQLVEALSMSANVDDMLGNPAGARHFLDQAEAIAANANHYLATIELIQAQTGHAFYAGDMETVTVKSSDGASLSRDAGDTLVLGSMLRNIATVDLLEGDLGTATARLKDALHVAREIDDRFTEYYLLSAYAYHAVESGQPRRAAQLFGVAASVAAGAGADDRGPHAPILAKARESATRALGEAKFGAEFEAGKRLTRQAALRLALGESDDHQIATPHGSETDPSPGAKSRSPTWLPRVSATSRSQPGCSFPSGRWRPMSATFWISSDSNHGLRSRAGSRPTVRSSRWVSGRALREARRPLR